MIGANKHKNIISVLVTN